MFYSPRFLSFQAADPFDHVLVNLLDGSNTSLAGAEIGVPPIVDGKYQIEFAVHALTPASYPALTGVEVRARIAVKLSGATSPYAFSAPFVFAQVPDPPFNLELDN